MMLPSNLTELTEWVFLGPMGPELPSQFKNLPRLGVDGGAHYSNELDLWVGDADSFQGPAPAPHIFRHPIEKDQSDLALALGLFKGPLQYKFHLWGFMGGRKDHELFNLGESMNFLEGHQDSQILFYGETGNLLYWLVGPGHWKFTHIGLFSIGSLKKTSIKLTGQCHYPIPRPSILTPLSSLGLSNVGSGEVVLETEGPVFIHFPEGE